MTVVRSRTLPPAQTSSTCNRTRSQPLSLLSMPRLKRARSRARCSSCSRIRIAQTSFGLSGRFCPVMRPLFQGVLFGRRDVCISPSMIASVDRPRPPSACQLAGEKIYRNDGSQHLFRRSITTPVCGIPPSVRQLADAAEWLKSTRSCHSLALFDDLVGSGEDRGRDCKAERVCGLEVDDKLEFRWLINRNVARRCPIEDLVHVIRDPASELGGIARICHQPTPLYIMAVGIHRRHAALLDKFDDRLTVGEKLAYVAHDDRTRRLLCDLGKHTLIRCGFLERHTDHGDFQLPACFQQLRNSSFPVRAHAQVHDLGC